MILLSFFNKFGGLMVCLEVFMQDILRFYYNISGYIGFHNWGIAIILLTITIKLLIYPLSIKQMKSMYAMQKVQPKLQVIQKKFGKDKVRLQKEIAQLYQTEKINPLTGCLPLLFQCPILFALYWAISGFNELRGASFLWISDLSMGHNIILAILSIITTYWTTAQMKNEKANSEINDNNHQIQQTMKYIMPLVMGWFTYNFAAGVGIYWITSNAIQVVQQWRIQKKLKN